MKTMKQVLAEFQRMQKQLICDGLVEVYVYCDGEYWAIRVQKLTFTDNHEVKTRDYVEWTHYTSQDEEQELDNEKLLAEFKEKFNLK